MHNVSFSTADSPHPEETENQLRQLNTAVRLDFPDAAYSIPMMQESNSLEMAFPFAGRRPINGKASNYDN